MALGVIDALAERWGVAVDEATLRRGMANARWPGRLEVLDGSSVGLGRVLLDGAHNPAGAAALARALEDLGVRRPTIVFGAMRTKRVTAVLRALAPLDPRFVFTRVDDPGAHEPEALAQDLAAGRPERRREPHRTPPRRWPWPKATRSSWRVPSISSARFAAC